MKFIPVKELPDRTAPHKNLQKLLEEFDKSDLSVAKIEWFEHEYKSADVCYACLSRAAKISGRPIKVTFRSGEIYIFKV